MSVNTDDNLEENKNGKLDIKATMKNTSSIGLDNILAFLKDLFFETMNEISLFLSENKKAILFQLGVAGLFIAMFMFLNVGFLHSALMGITGLMVYWAKLLKDFFTKRVFGKVSTAEIVIYTVLAVFGLYNPFHFDILHLGKYIYDLGGIGFNLYTVKVGIPFILFVYFWYYAARYTAETSYESLGAWKAGGIIFVYVMILIFIVAIMGLDNVAFYIKPFIFVAQLTLAYIIYEAFGFAKRHYSRSKTVTTNAKEGDEIGSSDTDDTNALNEAQDEEIDNIN